MPVRMMDAFVAHDLKALAAVPGNMWSHCLLRKV